MTYDIVITTYDVCLFACKKGSYFLHVFCNGRRTIFDENKIVAIHTRKRKDANLPNLKVQQLFMEHHGNAFICDESQKIGKSKNNDL